MGRLAGIMLIKARSQVSGMAYIPLCRMGNASKYVGVKHKSFREALYGVLVFKPSYAASPTTEGTILRTACHPPTQLRRLRRKIP